MKKTHAPLIIGNWKMNPISLTLAKQLFLDIRKVVSKRKLDVDVVVAPPYVYLADLTRLAPSHRVLLAAQDASSEKEGAHTGEVSVSMLKHFGVSSVILGHSERRADGESDEMVAKKLAAVLNSGLTAVVCVGERERDGHGDYFTFVEQQLRAALKLVKPGQQKRLVIAYEPVWAIGTGETATPEDAHEMKLFIQKVVADVCGRTAVNKIRILYGGSVNAKNAESLLIEGQVDGFLIGGASLRASEFISIVMTAEQYANS